MARRRKGRAIDGILLLDKPLEISSNQALQKVKRAFLAAKAGHTGALDPLATGMLPVCLGEATKFSQFLLDADKTYIVTAKLGVRTTTSDADGDVVETHDVNVTEQQLKEACETFKGPIKQVPSMFSALKHQGKPLYHYARQGIVIEREARDITIFSLNITRFEGDEVDMEVHCSKGTYIRSLVDDLGQLLGCCAYVSKLHRTAVADYPSEKMVTFEKLESLLEKAQAEQIPLTDILDPLLIPMDSAVKALPSVHLSPVARDSFLHGQPVPYESEELVAKGTLVRTYCTQGQVFLGVSEIDNDNKAAPKRVVVFSPQG
ncbi:tRNA pseudouridine(55) synthase TruB [Paraglaciecola chathamensis]|uniref:tRNA pseudouridine synthase B n=1 Tax=Paraglaciecola chathamensis TaxID=368405 RepID=A0A8H9I9W6_9ALTE|nr:tRNA pseudouridine(55) synthase TruB [Paraglaciecola oceanifecundans]GGZ60867.1 tRNA pseudouridine synthase B [Paraglaciecola oceanifecundans]